MGCEVIAALIFPIWLEDNGTLSVREPFDEINEATHLGATTCADDQTLASAFGDYRRHESVALAIAQRKFAGLKVRHMTVSCPIDSLCPLEMTYRSSNVLWILCDRNTLAREQSLDDL